jgi:hypothetical protein
MPGPPPNPNARRRNAGSGFTPLPAAGRPGPPPPWPLRTDRGRYDGRRRLLWEQLWATPMAELWDRHRWTVPVARYVELVLAYEEDPRDAGATLLSEMRQAEQLLGMTAVGLLKARAAIDPTTVPAAATAAAGGVGTASVVVLTPRTHVG